MTQSVDSSKRSKKHKPEVNLDPDLLSSDSSDSSSSDSAPKKKKSKKNKKRREHRKDDLSDPSSSDDSDSSDNSHYRRKQRKDKKHQKKDPIRLCATLTEKLLTTDKIRPQYVRQKDTKDTIGRYHCFTSGREGKQLSA